RQNRGAAEIGNKTSIFPDIDLGKWRPLPQRPSITQCRAAYPTRASGWVDIFPRALPRGVEKQHAIETANIGIASGEHLHLKAQAMRRVPVVIVPMGNDLAARFFASVVAFGADRLAVMMAKITDLRVRRDEIGDRIVAVVEDHQFPFGIILRQE